MEIVTTIAPFALALIMFGLGLGLTTTDFSRVLKNPTKKSFGFFITLEKLFVVSPRPNPNMIKAKANGAIFVTISINQERYTCYFITETSYF